MQHRPSNCPDRLPDESVLHEVQANAEVNAGGEARPPSRPQSASAGGGNLPEALQGGQARPEGVIDIRVDAGRGSDDGHLSVGSTPSSIQVGCPLQHARRSFSIATAYISLALVALLSARSAQLSHVQMPDAAGTFASGHQQTAAFQHLSSRSFAT
jgi:hypothetical protein